MSSQPENINSPPSFPGILWILPICFGVIGGVIAALISSLKYGAGWWGLFITGFIISAVTFLVYLILGYFIIA
jgi:uncharacterized membrane protein